MKAKFFGERVTPQLRAVVKAYFHRHEKDMNKARRGEWYDVMSRLERLILVSESMDIQHDWEDIQIDLYFITATLLGMYPTTLTALPKLIEKPGIEEDGDDA
jgi:hypothetical protein